MEELISSLVKYGLMAYSAQTFADIGERLVPPGVDLRGMQRATVREWLSTAAGVALALASGADILFDLGLILAPPVLGMLITGLIVGQGGRYLNQWLSGLPRVPRDK